MQKGKRLILKISLWLTLIACIVGFSICMINNNKNVVKADESAITSITLASLSYNNPLERADCMDVTFVINGGITLDTSLHTWWNDHASDNATINNGVDIMDYIYVNGTSARDLVNDNVKNSIYSASSYTMWPLTVESNQFRPIAVQANKTNGNVNILVSNQYAKFKAVIITFKAGFTLKTSDGTFLVLNSDMTFTTNSSNVFEEYTATTPDSVEMTDVSCALTDKTEHSYIVFTPVSSGSIVPNSNLPAYWDDHQYNANKYNYLVDIMDYIYVNGVSARNLSRMNEAGKTSYQATSGAAFPLNNGGKFAPVSVELLTSGKIVVRVYDGFAAKQTFTVTLKSGLAYLNDAGLMVTLDEDINFAFNTSGELSRECTLSFESTEGTVDPITVLNGNSVKLPTVPVKSGYSGSWQIDGVKVSSTLSYTYNADKTAVAVYEVCTDIEITDIDFSTMTPATEATQNTHLVFDFTAGGTIVPLSDLQGIWNDHPERASSNNGIDIMDYIYVNGTSIRALSNANKAGTTSYIATFGGAWPLTLGGCYAPVSLQFLASGSIEMRVYYEYATNPLNITFKSGFAFVNSDGISLVLNKDVAFGYNSSNVYSKGYTLSFESSVGTVDPLTVFDGSSITLPEVPEKTGYSGYWTIDGEKVSSPLTYNYGADKTAVAEYTEIVSFSKIYYYLNTYAEYTQVQFTFTSTASINGASTLIGFWNDHLERASSNNGIDLMEYIYVNGVSARELSNDNKSGKTSYIAEEESSFPFNKGGCYAPVSVELLKNGVMEVRIMHAYLDTEYVNVTLKNGFGYVNDAGKFVSVDTDKLFKYGSDGVFGQATTLSFEGLTETKEVVTGNTIGTLPEIIETGKIGYWTIGDEILTSDTVYTHIVDETATKALYTKIDLSTSVKMTYNSRTDCYQILLRRDGGILPVDNTKCYWNDHAGNAKYNFGIDIMKYITITDDTGKVRTAREISNDNKSGVTSYVGKDTWVLTLGGCYAPVAIQTEINGDDSYINIYIMKEFSSHFTITFETGFMLLGQDNVIYTFENELSYHATDSGDVRKYQEYTISFTGTDTEVSPITVVYGDKIGVDLPIVPSKAHTTSAVWKLDNTVITADTIYTWNENKTLTATYTELKYTILGHNMTISSDLTMNVYISLEDDTEVVPDVYFYAGDDLFVKDIGGKQYSSKIYIYKFAGLTAQNIDTVYTEKIMVGDEVYSSSTYSMREYLTYLSKNNATDKIKALIGDIVSYGQELDKVANNKTESSIENISGCTPSTYVAPTSTDLKIVSEEGRADGDKFISAILYYTNANNIIVKFSVESSTNFYVTIDGVQKGYTETETENTYEIMTNSIYATAFDHVYTFKLYVDDALVQTLTYSVRSYVLGIKDTSTQKDLVERLYAYGKSVEAYVGEQHEDDPSHEITYTITYDLDGGEVGGNPTEYTEETATFTINNPTKEGYVFRGWLVNGAYYTRTLVIEKGSTMNYSLVAYYYEDTLYDGAEITLLPDVVTDYLACETESEVAEYLQALPVASGTESIKISWVNVEKVEVTKIEFSFDDTFNTIERTEEISSSIIEDYKYVFNLIPNSIYYYRVVDCNDNVIKVDSFTMSDSFRIIYVDGIKNMRDLGGKTGLNGATIQYGLVYRSASLDALTDSGEDTFANELGIKTELDLRYGYTKTEMDIDINYVNGGIGQWYYVIPNISDVHKAEQKYLDNLKKGLLLFTDTANFPIDFHCAAGADRTGTFAFFLEGLLGVSYEEMVADFELTSFYLGNPRWRSNIISDGSGGYKFDESGVMEDDTANLIAFDKCYRYILDTYGEGNDFCYAVEQFLITEIGLTEENIESIRINLLGANYNSSAKVSNTSFLVLSNDITEKVYIYNDQIMLEDKQKICA